jgi:hypothetical protein
VVLEGILLGSWQSCDRACTIMIIVFSANNDMSPEYRKLYLKKVGQYDFQIDLGMVLLNYVIKLGGPQWTMPWMDVPKWFLALCMWQMLFLFDGLTNDIAHKCECKVKIPFVQWDNIKTVQEGCTDKHINLHSGCSYCIICYRKLCNGTPEEQAMSSVNKKVACSASRMGCACCNEVICKKCWAEGRDMHTRK